ncbi:helicase HerA domain-containing protein [Microbacterium kunmingense]|uniref:helicase HerA domain-containing protein n=1 Tax=Microbacterium kunmingense TaxID=2915939 RepID=UPI002003D003|nr:DUF87 domain-containing protein [Microbacterium kunmingense]
MSRDLLIGTLVDSAPATTARVLAPRLNRHTFWCGESGSGKTYALGVLLEQVLLHTRLPLVVLDPTHRRGRRRAPQWHPAIGLVDQQVATTAAHRAVIGVKPFPQAAVRPTVPYVASIRPWANPLRSCRRNPLCSPTFAFVAPANTICRMSTSWCRAMQRSSSPVCPARESPRWRSGRCTPSRSDAIWNRSHRTPAA